jgi:hypothetical protein
MRQKEMLWELEGLHTVETVEKTLNITRQSAINLLSKLKKQGHVTVKGGGRIIRIYKITMRKQLPRQNGMFDIINKYSPMKLAPWFDHQVHGHYGPEEALIDAIQTESFRVILASMRLFGHITDWPKLYTLAKKRDCWQKVGALYDVARLHFRVKRMPEKYYVMEIKNKKFLIKNYPTKEPTFFPIEKKWHVPIPFRKGDMLKVAS